MRKKTLIDKKITKHVARKCYFCPEDNYATLACHRIVPGEEGGKYTDANTVVVCANHHTKIHDGHIVIDRKYPSTAGKTVLHFWEDGVEKWE